MAELALGFAGALGGGGVAAGAGAGIGTGLTILQGVLTAGSAIASIMAGQAASDQAKFSAQMALTRGESERLASEQKIVEIRKETVRKIGAARVAFAGSGLDISSGGAIEEALGNEAEFLTSIEQTNARLRMAEAKMQAAGFQARAGAELAGSYLKAGLGIGKGLLDINKRG